jgi:sugar phosphate isomerase/epimerase
MNIHPGESLDDVMEAGEEYALKVKARVSPDKPFALGLRLSGAAATEFLPRLGEFGYFLERNGFYVVSINGFPFGPFNQPGMKEKVYLPDWTSHERVGYTLTLANILGELLPEGESGTISTVPLRYGNQVDERVFPGLVFLVVFLKKLKERTGKHITLCLEPEPDCSLDSLSSTLDFFKKIYRISTSAKTHLGICLDTCHSLVEFESPLEWLNKAREQNIRIPKVQISAALRTGQYKALEKFEDNIYLHQTRVKTVNGIEKFKDLPEALKDPSPEMAEGEWRSHFHVPLTWSSDRLSTTAELIEDDFFREISLGNRHIEVETYSYDILPGPKQELVGSIISELEWTRKKLIRPLP